MKFHLLYSSKDSNGNLNKIPEFFKDACKEKDVEFVGHDVHSNGSTFSLSTLPILGKGDLLYRNAAGTLASTAERIMNNEDVTTFYTNWFSVNKARIASWFTHIKFGLPVVPSYPGVPGSTEELENVVEKLGSFPIIIKVMGGSLGVGVMRIDSMKSLQSILDYLKSKQATVMLRKYIPHDYYVRAIVVGHNVVASHAAFAMDGEFRTNAGDDTDQKREVKELSEEVKEVAVQAVHTLGFETGGVDMLFDKNEKPYIAEVNFPNNFKVTQRVTEINVAREMVEYLINKCKMNN
jgi:RimK family alpha-L-glutamate ligase